MSEFVGVVLFAMALIWLVALASYSSTDPVWFFNTGSELPPQNFAGRIGAFLAELSFQLLGYAAYLISIALVVVGWHYFWCRVLEAPYTKLIGASILFICVSSFLSLASENIEISGKEFYAGGYAGTLLADFLATYLNRTGSIIFLFTLLFLAIILTTQISLGRLSSATITGSKKRIIVILESFQNWNTQRKRKRKRQEIVKKHLLRTNMPEPKSQPGTLSESKEPELPLSHPNLPKPEKQNSSDIKLKKKTPLIRQKSIETKTVKPSTHVRKSSSKSPAERRSDSFNLPPLALLNSPKKENKINERALMEGARLLEEKCREFSVDGAVVQIHPGPVVTTYEFKPHAGVKYAKITSLAEDLSLAMQAESVLIERIAGKSTVGIQIPNQIREQISLRELLESETYTHSNSKLTLALGKTIHGEPYVADLATMPHVLIAGATGTGKSVAVNAMLTSILYRATPDQVRLIMIDPKRLELGMYEDIPHLMTPVVVDPKQAANALRWAVREMEERYKTLASLGVRNIEQYNRNVSIDSGIQKNVRSNNRQEDSEADEKKPLPYIVVVIDELADLMMVAGNEVEESIARLAQMARAVGIHLILATQRPSVDVITGLIKANLNSRISCRVASKTDSRTILDSNGAERLLGKGDMLFLPPSSSRLMRLHGSYISEQESARLASYLRKQGEPNYDKTITTNEKPLEPVGLEDELYDQAARIIVSSGQASISYLQRRLRVGFSRAARLIDMMELEGLISQGTGGKSREVLVSKDYFDEVDKQLR